MTQWWWAVLTALCVVGCQPEEAPRNAVDAPTTPEAQVELIREELGRAEAARDWVRAEVLIDVLMLLEPESVEHKRRLRSAQQHRKHVRTLKDVASLLEAGALRTARARLETLQPARLSEDEVRRHAELRVWLKELESNPGP